VYRSRAIDAIKQQVPLVSIDYRMYCEVVLFPPDRRDRDLDNYMKALLDAATHAGLWDDDSLIDQLAIYRGSVLKGGLVKLEIAHAGPIISSPMTQTV
jgi:crossover junction endodeoxyribonuclease RusA